MYEENWKDCQCAEEQKSFEIYILSFLGCMKKIGKIVKILKRKSFEIYTLSFSGRMKKIGKLSERCRAKAFRCIFGASRGE